VDAAGFYDSIAPYFHFIHPDWAGSVERQGEQLDGLIRERVPGARTVLDCACGIGTQALGLAARGYEVHASDIAPSAVARARREAAKRGLAIRFSIADMREIEAGPFDVVLAADNAVPHLPDDEEILRACRAFRRCTRPGGAAVVSVRDYDAMEKVGLQLQPHAVRRLEDELVSVFQVREFDGAHYVIHLHVVVGDRVHVARTRYYAVSLTRLAELLREAGFADVERIDDRFYQPLLVAR